MRFRFTRTSVLVLILGLFAYPAHAQITPGVSDHSGWVKYYEKKISEQDALIEEHTKMKQNSAKGLEKHCEAIIRDVEKLKIDLLETEKWHRMQAGSDGR